MNPPLFPRTPVDRAFAELRRDLLHDDGPRISTMRNYRFAILQYLPRDEFFSVEYAIPPSLTTGKQKVTVRFQAHPDCMAGGVFGLSMLRPAVEAAVTKEQRLE